MKLFNIRKVKQKKKKSTQKFYLLHLKKTWINWLQKDRREFGRVMIFFLGGSFKTECQNSKSGTPKMGGFYLRNLCFNKLEEKIHAHRKLFLNSYYFCLLRIHLLSLQVKSNLSSTIKTLLLLNYFLKIQENFLLSYL